MTVYSSVFLRRWIFFCNIMHSYFYFLAFQNSIEWKDIEEEEYVIFQEYVFGWKFFLEFLYFEVLWCSKTRSLGSY